ncbi:hypothetical protein EG68_12593 [Paragonimus skrjabini miyazakii]|uniref:Uncharacterized protein n=1 Tax=Paragonimus skrjabini miyazakii TaxID=59628 RepID=A0A8S9YHA5_9TREM|nr:hypothetical protein EG68_12593 [Paragonimus skrjabini miyazakii]
MQSASSTVFYEEGCPCDQGDSGRPLLTGPKDAADRSVAICRLLRGHVWRWCERLCCTESGACRYLTERDRSKRGQPVQVKESARRLHSSTYSPRPLRAGH